MSQGYSFDGTAGTSQNTSKPRLESNSIHKVKLEKVEALDIDGVKTAGAVYKVVKFRFSNDDGYYEHTVFELKPEDFTRTKKTITDKKTNKEILIEQPSNYENLTLFLKHLIDAFVPEVGAKIDKKEINLSANSWDDFRKLIVKIFEKGVNRTSNIKLMETKDGEPRLPGFFSGLTKDGVAYVKNNFAGDKVAFESYELTRINNKNSATPSSVNYTSDPSAVNGSFAETVDTSLDLNFDLDGI